MIFIQLKNIDEKKADIICTVYQPQNLTEEELKTGVMIEESAMPVPEYQQGKCARLLYNYSTKEITIEYRDIEKTPEQILQETVDSLKKENLDLQVALAESIEQQAKDKLELQTAMAELIESISTGGAV